MRRRPRAPLALLVTASIAACATPTPMPTTAPSAAGPTVAPTVLETAPSPTAAPTLSPSPEPVLESRGVEAFDPLASGKWVMAATTDNLDGARTSVDRALTESAEITAVCSGHGTVHVTVVANPPATEADQEQVALYDHVLQCPDLQGETFSMGGAAPAGWFANADANPSDPSIRYQVLIGTIVD